MNLNGRDFGNLDLMEIAHYFKMSERCLFCKRTIEHVGMYQDELRSDSVVFYGLCSKHKKKLYSEHGVLEIENKVKSV